MKALTFSHYTSPAGLVVTPIARPQAGEDRIVVEVGYASVNPIDWHYYRGAPLLMRTKGPRGKGPWGLGEDFAGRIVEVGPEVTGYAVGDRVFGTIPATVQRYGSIAEFVDVKPEWLTRIPAGVDPAQAGAVGLAGLTALQALRDTGGLNSGDRVLIWGASGGVGHLAVQIAHLLGAQSFDVVCSGTNAATMRELGADRIWDYTSGERPQGTYQVIIDTVCTASVRELRDVLVAGGRVVTIGARSGGKVLGPVAPMATRAIANTLRVVSAHTLLTRVNASDLALLAQWMHAGDLQVRIRDTYSLGDASDAYRALEKGSVRGKLSIRISSILERDERATPEKNLQ